MTLRAVNPSGEAAPLIDSGRRVLAREREALDALAGALDQDFAAACRLLLGTPGRVVVSGMGKSGHVARKIAATLASTGTPAQFVHPAEASHGDLGMITRQDRLILLSNSGEAEELVNLINHAKRYLIGIVGITSGAQSMLAKASDIALILPKVPEACPMGLAPTTSTTMMLALGDALAVALMEAKGFSVDDYRIFHPGGKLGKRLLTVADVMHSGSGMPAVRLETSLADAILEMSSKRLGVTTVLDAQGGLHGIITDGDLRRKMTAKLFEERAGEIMTRDPKTIGPDALASEALGLLQERQITCLVVTEAATGDARPKAVGVVHFHDLLKAGVA